MGNKLGSSPIPSYDSATGQYGQDELAQIRKNFYGMSQGRDTVTLEKFVQAKTSYAAYIRRYLLPRVFTVFDTKKDNLLDFDEYLCAVTVFRRGTIEDKIKCLYLMYEGTKNGSSLPKDKLKQLLVDSTVCTKSEDCPLNTLDEWISNLNLLSLAMVETALYQYSNSNTKMDLAEFIAFVKVEGTIQELLHIIPMLIDS